MVSKTICRGNLLWEPEVGRASWKGKDIELTVSEFKLVALIASNDGEYVPYRQLYDSVRYEGFTAGGGADGYRANTRSLIKRIRRKFQECDPTFDEIQNYHGFGYCWSKPPL